MAASVIRVSLWQVGNQVVGIGTTVAAAEYVFTHAEG